MHWLQLEVCKKSVTSYLLSYQSALAVGRISSQFLKPWPPVHSSADMQLVLEAACFCVLTVASVCSIAKFMVQLDHPGPRYSGAINLPELLVWRSWDGLGQALSEEVGAEEFKLRKAKLGLPQDLVYLQDFLDGWTWNRILSKSM